MKPENKNNYFYVGRSGKVNGMNSYEWFMMVKYTGWVYNNKHKTKEYFVDGQFHKDNGPTISSAKFKVWKKDGKLHREDGPAVERENGNNSWYLDDVRYDKIIKLKEKCVLSEYKGKYGLVWYKILDEDEIVEIPNIPGLIDFS